MTRIEEIRARLAMTTGGRWTTAPDGTICVRDDDRAWIHLSPSASTFGEYDAQGEVASNAAFIAHCGGDNGDVAYLLARVDRLKEAVALALETPGMIRGRDELTAALEDQP